MIIFLTCLDSRRRPRPPPTTPALLDTAVRPVMLGVAFTSLMRVSGTPERPKPPHRRVESDFIPAIAADGEETTLLISLRR